MKNSKGTDTGSGSQEGFLHKRTDALYRALMDHDRIAIMVVRAPEGTVLEAGRGCAEILGYPESEITGMQIASFMSAVPDILISQCQIDDQTDSPSRFEETTWKHSSGREIPVSMTIGSSDLEDECIYLVLARDLSELKEKERSLIASDERYHDLVRNSGEGMGTVDTDEIFVFANPAACEIFGLPEDQLIGKSLNSFLDKHSVDEIKRQTTLRKKGQKSIYEIEIIRPSGEKRWIIVTATPQYDSNRKFTGTLGIFRDITDRRLAETRLRESEQRLHEIVDITNDWIWEIDPLWKYSFVSPRVIDILGYRPDEMIGRSPFDFVHPADAEKIQTGIRSLVHQYKPITSIVNKAVHKDGQTVYLETSGIPVFDENGNYRGYRGADRDITFRKKYEQELILAKEKAEESDKLKTSILANMSHELRTPLNGILGFAEVLKDELADSGLETMIDNIYDSGRRLMSTLNSIIILSQLESGNITLTRRTVLLNPLIHSVLESLGSFLSEKEIILNTSGLRPFSVVTDETLVIQLLQQILDNAIKFTDRGSITIETIKTTEQGNVWVVIRVSDTGIGIDSANFDLIFKEFRQVSEGFGRKYQGSGIGLTISRKIIDLLGGRITIESTPGKGSCFSVWLPCEPGEASASDHPETNTSENSSRNQAHTDTMPVILLIEDNKVNKELTVLFLKGVCRVEWAPDAASALEKATNRVFDAVLVDIHLGQGMNGIEATRELRKMNGYTGIPIIAVTGYTMEEDKVELLAAGCTSYIAKPFEKRGLIKAVRDALRGDTLSEP